MKFPLILVTLIWAAVFIVPLRAEVQGSISSYVWSNEGEFNMGGSHPSVQNQWDIKHPTDSMMLGGNAYLFELKYDQILSFDLNYNTGAINDQRRSFIVHDSNGYLTDLSYADVAGRSRLTSTGLFYRLMGQDELAISRLDVGAGYVGYINSVGYNNASVVLDSANPANNNQTFNERWEEYDIYYHGVDARIKGELYLTPDISVNATVGYAPKLSARYKYTKFTDRIASQQQKQTIKAEGYGWHYEAALNYHLTEHFTVMAGYKYVLLNAEGKSDDNFYPFWSGAEHNLKNEMGGYIFGVTYHF
ncbi:MAG: hypothetical protein HZA49_07315 [Planctomycetes bacterium]|nr:hypothetical protein [Planctomycetota bacterium]